MLIDTTDALGGTGSIPADLRNLATNGLSRLIDGYLSKKYPLTSFNETQAVDAYGNVLPKGAPQTQVTPGNTLKALLSQPVVVGTGLALVVTIIVIAALRR